MNQDQPPRTTNRAGTVAVERDGNTVTISMEFADHYHAMQVYDEAIASAKRGELRVNLTTAERVQEH